MVNVPPLLVQRRGAQLAVCNPLGNGFSKGEGSYTREEAAALLFLLANDRSHRANTI